MTWTTDQLVAGGGIPCYGWGLVIFLVEPDIPDGYPAEFDCGWAPSSLIDIVARPSPNVLETAQDLMYARGYYVDWHTLPVVEWPTDVQHPAGTWS